MLPEIHAAPMYHYFAKKLTSEEVVAPFEASVRNESGWSFKRLKYKIFCTGFAGNIKP